MTCHTYLANEGQISYTVSVERIIGLTMCKVLFLKILTLTFADLYYAHVRKIPASPYIFAFEMVETVNEATFPVR